MKRREFLGTVAAGVAVAAMTVGCGDPFPAHPAAEQSERLSAVESRVQFADNLTRCSIVRDEATGREYLIVQREGSPNAMAVTLMAEAGD